MGRALCLFSLYNIKGIELGQFLLTLKPKLLKKVSWIRICFSLCQGFPPEFRVTVCVRKWSRNFFHFHYEKVPENRNSGKPEFRNDFRNDFFPVKRKFPECCSRIMDRYGIPERSGNFPKNCSGNFRFSKRLVP